MASLQLKYGRTTIPLVYDENRFGVLGGVEDALPLSDAQIGEKLDSPVDSLRLEEIVSPGEKVLFVVPDATRQTGCGQIINLLVRRLIANGTAPYEMAVIFATGIHRKVTEAEMQAILTPFIARRIKTLHHSPRDLVQIVRFGEISEGIPVELNRALTEFDRVVLIGGITFHYFAGFTGGRKLVCPGLASARTVSLTHKLAFDCNRKNRRDGVGSGVLDGNAVHEAFVEAASKIEVSFCVSTIANDAGQVVEVFCGDWLKSHRSACYVYAEKHTVKITKKRDLVIASCGGYPYDINLIQAHKAIEAASHACTDGGRILLLAECSDGLGRDDFLDWFESENSDELAEKLCRNYKVNGQTAWSLLKKAERFRIGIMTALEDQTLGKMRLNRLPRLESLSANGNGYILPFGAKFRITG